MISLKRVSISGTIGAFLLFFYSKGAQKYCLKTNTVVTFTIILSCGAAQQMPQYRNSFVTMTTSHDCKPIVGGEQSDMY